MTARTQNFANHRSFPSALYLTAAVVLAAEACRRGWEFGAAPSWDGAWSTVVATAILVVLFVARRSAQIVQDRVIRLEMHTRLVRLLGEGRRDAIEAIELRDLVALRFASDAELPELVDRVARGEFARPSDIKRAVVHWRADWLRV